MGDTHAGQHALESAPVYHAFIFGAPAVEASRRMCVIMLVWLLALVYAHTSIAMATRAGPGERREGQGSFISGVG